jgi:uncharacterized membrane protein YbhN (UPF0104 family)
VNSGRLLRALQVPLVLALFAFFIFRLDPSELADALRGADPAVVLAAIAINIPICVLFGVRMNLVLRRQGHQLAPDLVLASAIVGNVAGALTPASSGEILRAAALRSHSEVSVDDAVALIVFERGLSVYLLALGTLAAVCTMVLPPFAAAIACAGCFAALALPFVLAPLLDRLPELHSTTLVAASLNRLRPAARQLRALLRNRGLLTSWFATSGAVFALFALQYWILARSIENVVSLREMWIAFGASQLAAIVTLIPLGLGAADASLAGILRRYGMTLEDGTAVAILVRATNTLPMIVIAAASYLYLARRTPLERIHTGALPAQD